MNVVAVTPVLNEPPRDVAAMTAKLYANNGIAHVVVLPSSPLGDDAGRYGCVLRAGAAVIRQKSNGCGAAYRDGFRRALDRSYCATHILMIDADGEADVETVPAMLAAARDADADAVVASRWARGSRFVGYRRDKLALNWAFNKLARIALNSPVTDHTFTFKLLKREVVEAFDWTADRQDIGSQTTMWPIAAGYRVVEVPTVWRARKGTSPATLSLAGNLRHVRAAAQAVAMKWSNR